MRRLASLAFEDFCRRGGFSGETILTCTFLVLLLLLGFRVRYGGVPAGKEKCAAGRAWLSGCFAVMGSLDLEICGNGG